MRLGDRPPQWEDYLRIAEAQDYRCAIHGCGKAIGPHEPHDCLDHDHETGQVRGVLCAKHNRLVTTEEEHLAILLSRRVSGGEAALN